MHHWTGAEAPSGISIASALGGFEVGVRRLDGTHLCLAGSAWVS